MKLRPFISRDLAVLLHETRGLVQLFLFVQRGHVGTIPLNPVFIPNVYLCPHVFVTIVFVYFLERPLNIHTKMHYSMHSLQLI